MHFTIPTCGNNRQFTVQTHLNKLSQGCARVARCGQEDLGFTECGAGVLIFNEAFWNCTNSPQIMRRGETKKQVLVPVEPHSKNWMKMKGNGKDRMEPALSSSSRSISRRRVSYMAVWQWTQGGSVPAAVRQRQRQRCVGRNIYGVTISQTVLN